MSHVPFDTLPDSSRLWTFHAARTLSDDETAVLRGELESFVETWAAHRRDLTAGCEVRYNRFMLIGVDESKLPPSGCSIDSMVHALMALGARMGVELVDAPEIAYRDAAGAVQSVSRPEFARLAEEGTVTGATVVFDRTAERLGDVHSGRWERAAGDAWHARAFKLGTSAARSPFTPGTYAGSGRWSDRSGASGTYTVHNVITVAGSTAVHTIERTFLDQAGSVQFVEHSVAEFRPAANAFIDVTLTYNGSTTTGPGYRFESKLHYDMELAPDNRMEISYALAAHGYEMFGSSTNRGNPTAWYERLEASA